MRSISLALFATAVLVTGLGAQGQSKRVSAALEGENEVPVVISPEATGRFTATIDEENHAINYELTYSGLQAPITQSHIHVGQEDVTGGIVAWLCQTTTNPAPLPPVPTCPQSGTVTGVINVNSIVTVPAQGFAATLSPQERFHRLVDAIRSGNAYANIHTTQSPAGEIRGQIERGAGHH